LDKKIKYNNNNKSGVSGACGGRGATAKLRRSITIMDKLHLEILKLRGQLMILGIDIDYTTMLNICLEFGIKKMNSKDFTREDAKLITDYASDPKLKEDALYDVLRDNFVNSISQIPKK
jgi:hypothetical protein